MRATRWAGAAVALLATLAMTVPPAAATEPEGELAQEMRALRRALERIDLTLQEMMRARRAELVLRRLELEERRLAPLAGELRSARGIVRDVGDEIGRLEAMDEQTRAEFEERRRAGETEEVLDNYENMRRELETRLAIERARLADAERRVLELENDLERGSRAIRLLDERLLEALEDLD